MARYNVVNSSGDLVCIVSCDSQEEAEAAAAEKLAAMDYEGTPTTITKHIEYPGKSDT